MDVTTDLRRAGRSYDHDKLARLDHRATMLAPATRLVLEQAGIARGMRVLDLGTGTGAVAHLAAELVGPTGHVRGVDQDAGALAVADERRRAAGVANVSFVEGDAASWVHDGAFDAVVGRLVLFQLPDPLGALRHHVHSLPPGAPVVVMDIDASAMRSVPPAPAVSEVLRRIVAGLERVGADPTIGSRLGELLAAAGLAEPTVLGFSTYHGSGDVDGLRLLAGLVHGLRPVLEADGAPLDPDGLPERLARDLSSSGAVLVPPALVGAWATVPASGQPGNVGERVHAFDASQCWCRHERPAVASGW